MKISFRLNAAQRAWFSFIQLLTIYSLAANCLTVFQNTARQRNVIYQPGVEKNPPKRLQEVNDLKQQLLNLGVATDRGFRAQWIDRNFARDLIFDLASYSAVREPARAYYSPSSMDNNGSNAFPPGTTSIVEDEDQDANIPTLTGKWTLVYTDAPDITSLGNSNVWAKLGRIGQDCTSPPLIKNVIEWKRPGWTSNLPFSGTTESRILQKVVTRGSAQPLSPTSVELSVAGLALDTGATVDDNNNSKSRNFLDSIQKEGLVVGILQSRGGIDVSGPWNPPFGSFEILYLDDNFRITKTSQNFLAVNTRVQPGEEWF